MKQRILGMICLILFSVWLAGCGSSGDGGGNGGGGGGGGTITPQQRAAALKAVEDKLNAMPHDNGLIDGQEMLQFLQNRPEFEASGLNEDGSLWARFKDGRPLFIATNLDFTGALGKAASLPALPSRAPTPGLPKSSTVAFLNSVHGFPTTPDPDLKKWLPEKGYTIRTEDTSVQSYRNLNKRDGIVYLHTHGCYAELRNKTSAYGIMTGQLAIPFEEHLPANSALKADLDNYRVGYGLGFDSFIGLLLKVNPSRYMILPEFVRQYMKFSENSLAYLNVCSSNNETDSKAMRTAFFAAGISVYGGWTHTSLMGGQLAPTRLFFDRLLGMNQAPEAIAKPPIRPFDYELAWGDVTKHGFDHHISEGKTTQFILTPNPNVTEDAFRQLVPSIAQAGLIDEENKKLTLYGNFGKDRRSETTVTLGGKQLHIADWQQGFYTGGHPDGIVCDQLPPDAAGDLQVTIARHPSNKVPVTLLRGKFHVKSEFLNLGSLQYTVDLDLSFRLDVHGYRIYPDRPITAESIGTAFPMQASRCTFSASGSWQSDPFHTEAWSGTGSVPSYLTNHDPENNFRAVIYLEQNRTLRLEDLVVKLAKAYDRTLNGDPIEKGPIQLVYLPGKMPDPNIQLDSHYNAPATNKRTATLGNERITFWCDGITATHAPTGTTSRSAR